MEKNRQLGRIVVVALVALLAAFGAGILFARHFGFAASSSTEVEILDPAFTEVDSDEGDYSQNAANDAASSGDSYDADATQTGRGEGGDDFRESEREPSNQSESTGASDIEGVEKDGYYYDLEHVVLYLETYGELPPNYITKSEARSLGWEGGTPERYQDGAAIGGDRFGNREGNLPKGTSYTECDIDTLGKSSRGAKRLVFSDDGHYYYTTDHYDSFVEVFVEDGQVVY